MATGAPILVGRGVYRTPDGKQAARYAGVFLRLVGSIIDWFICFFWFFFSAFASSFLWNTFAADTSEEEIGLAGWAWLVVVAIGVVAYFTFTVTRGATLGMRLVHIRILDPETGKPPRRSRALIRALMATALGGSVLVLFNFVVSDTNATTPTTAGLTLVAVAFLLFLAGIWSHLWALFDPRGQTAQDRIAGVVVVGKMVDIPEDLVLFDDPAGSEEQPEPTMAAPSAPATASAGSTRKNRKRRRRR